MRYVFRKPLWLMLLPLILAAGLYGLPFGYDWLLRFENPNKYWETARTGLTWLVDHGVTVESMRRALWYPIGGLLALAYFATERFEITSQYARRRLWPFPAKRLRWEDLDEVLIDEVQLYFEAPEYAKRTLTLYGVPRAYLPWRVKVRITNRQFDGYEEAEQLATMVAVPSIAARRLREARRMGRPSMFAALQPGARLRGTVQVLLGAGLLTAAALDNLWSLDAMPYRTWAFIGAAWLLILGVTKFFYTQIGIDLKNLYVFRNGWKKRTIPLETICRAETNGNGVRIFACDAKGRERTVLKTEKFVRNRAALLYLLREAMDTVSLRDAEAIPAVGAAPDSEVYEGEVNRANEES